tara:strand:- start:210 stop:932 length:723 start_codon:yes stop_codon:yes gene_type:complete
MTLSASIPFADAQQRNWPSFSVAQSRNVDRLAIERFGISGIELMRNAGKACAERLLRDLPESAPATMILAGAGNNGGDGYVIAKCLAEANRSVFVVSLVPISKLSGDAKLSHEDATAEGVLIEQADAVGITARINEHDGMIVDCMLGTGSQGAPRSPFAEAILAANQKIGLRRVAIDLPSGLDGDTGEPAEPTFQADLTLTFVAPKTGITRATAASWTGGIEIIDIGIPLELKRQLGLPG